MDGLSIKSSDISDITGQTERRLNRVQQGPTNSLSTGPSKSIDTGFVDTLKQAINNVNEVQKDADIKAQRLATGQGGNLHDTMIAMEKADISLRLMVQVRNKIIEAYQEIMRMQV